MLLRTVSGSRAVPRSAASGRRQQVRGAEVILEMHRAQLALGVPDLCRERGQRLGRHRACRKLLVQHPRARDHRLACRDGFGQSCCWHRGRRLESDASASRRELHPVARSCRTCDGACGMPVDARRQAAEALGVPESRDTARPCRPSTGREMRALDLHVIHQRDDVCASVSKCVGPRRRLGLAVAARIEAHHAIARRQRRRQLVPDRHVGGERMVQHHGTAVSDRRPRSSCECR